MTKLTMTATDKAAGLLRLLATSSTVEFIESAPWRVTGFACAHCEDGIERGEAVYVDWDEDITAVHAACAAAMEPAAVSLDRPTDHCHNCGALTNVDRGEDRTLCADCQ